MTGRMHTDALKQRIVACAVVINIIFFDFTEEVRP